MSTWYRSVCSGGLSLGLLGTVVILRVALVQRVWIYFEVFRGVRLHWLLELGIVWPGA